MLLAQALLAESTCLRGLPRQEGTETSLAGRSPTPRRAIEVAGRPRPGGRALHPAPPLPLLHGRPWSQTPQSTPRPAVAGEPAAGWGQGHVTWAAAGACIQKGPRAPGLWLSRRPPEGG